MPLDRVGTSSLAPVDLPGLDQAYIVSNPQLEALLFNRNLIGTEFLNTCAACSRSLLQYLRPEITRSQPSIAELLILTKGLCYQISIAYAELFGNPLELNFVALRRVSVSREATAIDLAYSSIDSPADTILIGDTIASGATMCEAIGHYLSKWPLTRVIILTFAGTGIGGKRIAEFCAARNVACTIIYGLAVFGLAANGFDLSFLDPATVTSDRCRQLAKEYFGSRPISCVGWDFGSQGYAIRKYKMLCWIESKYWGVGAGRVFQQTERPVDPRIVEKEHAAYAGVFPSIYDLLKSSEPA